MNRKVILKKRTADAGGTAPRGSAASAPGPSESDRLLVTCPGGVEHVTAAELTELGFQGVQTTPAAVHVHGEIAAVERLNRELRTASRVLVPIADLKANTFDALYAAAKAVPWERYITPEDTFLLAASTRSERLKDHRFLAMRVKDAIVDRQRDHYAGKRSSIDKSTPSVVFTVHADDDRVAISIDSTGDPLHRRGYRTEAGEAPLRETVAAMLLLDSGYRNGDSRRVFDPFCGSGTIVIEAALIATGRGPGTLGRRFAYQRWPWRRAADENTDTPMPRGVRHRGGAEPRFIGTDSDPDMIALAQRNAERAGVADLVRFEVSDVGDAIPRIADGPPGLIVTNPPYGVRMRQNDPGALYSELGALLRRAAGGWSVTVIAGDRDSIGKLGLKPDLTRRVYNGAIAATMGRYTVFDRESRRMGKDR